MKYPWGTNRRFNSYTEYLRKHFGGRVQKLSINAGFTCPNRDGTKGTGGCTFCVNDAFSPSYCQPEKSISQQITEGISFHLKRYKNATKYMAYFQSYSNTYKPLEELKPMYNEVLAHDEVIGIAIGTRPDCITEPMLEYFAQLSKKVHLVIEYGVESCLNSTLLRINRGHTFEQSVEAILKTKEYGLNIGAHFILGLPGEDSETALQSAKKIAKLPIDFLKFHQLQIIKGTAMADDYKRNPTAFELFTPESYIRLCAAIAAHLNPNQVVERWAGEIKPEMNAGVPWNLRYDQFLNLFEGYLETNDLWQGKLYT